MTSAAGAISLILPTSSTPLPSGSLTSHSTTSGSYWLSSRRPVVQSGACSTSYPSSPMMRASSARSWGSSSIIRIFAIAVRVLCGKGTTKFEIVDMLLRRPSRNPAVRLWCVFPVGIAMRSCRSGRPVAYPSARSGRRNGGQG